MAVFRDSRLSSNHLPSQFQEESAAVTQEHFAQEHSIGDLIREAKNLSAEEVEKILHYQRQKGVRFGEAAVALGFASQQDVLHALSKQYHYPFASDTEHKINKELVTGSQPFSRQAESFRMIRSQLLNRLFKPTETRRALAIVSPDVKDGKSFFSANLAITFSQLGGRTLLVDANLRNPRQHELFALDNATGLSTILSGRGTRNIIRSVGAFPSLFILPAGNVPPNPLELIERAAFALLMRELTNKFDYVIVDTAAGSHGADAVSVASRCGAALVVARKGSSRLHTIETMVHDLQDTSAKVVGSIFNEVEN